MKLKQFLTDHREKLQLVYGVFLLILIPSLIAFNSISIIGQYNGTLDKTLQRHALSAGRSVYTFLGSDLEDTAALQRKIEALMERNTEFESIDVLVPEGEGFKVAASSDTDHVGDLSDFYYYTVAWKQPDNDGLATDSVKLSASGQASSRLGTSAADGRFWMVAMPMQDSNGNKKAILSIRVSSEIVDALTDANKDSAIRILLLTILITIFFLLVTVKIWDYVLLYSKIKEVDQLKDEFISMASHELRTPLTAIKGYTSLILEDTFGKIENPQLRQSVERIMTSVQRLEELVEDLLNVSRLEQKRLSIEIQPLEMEPIVDEIVEQLSITAAEKKLALSYAKPSPSLPRVSADPERMKQVLINLIGNAIKYTETGSVTVTTTIEEGKFRLKVTDTGIGISPEGQARLFQKFYRVQTEKTEKIRGTGLGLWITKQIVELMGGEIFVESIEGQGTQMIVVLGLAEERK